MSSERGRSVAITGAASGIGAAIALELAAPGTMMELADRDEAGLAELVATLAGRGVTAHASRVDVRDSTQVDDFVERAASHTGRLDVLVASAGVCDVLPVQEADPRLWRVVLETNALGSFHALGSAARVMASQGHGDLVAVASVSADIVYVGQPAYIASKHALDAFSDSLRMELAPHGVRVLVLKPGLVDTPMSRAADVVDTILTREAALDPRDCARAVRFAIEMPQACSVNEIVLRPTGQVL